MVRLKKAGMVYQMWRWKVFRSHSLTKATKLQVFLHVGDVNSSVWCGNVTSDTVRYQEAEDLPHEMSPRYSGNHPVGHAKEC